MTNMLYITTTHWKNVFFSAQSLHVPCQGKILVIAAPSESRNVQCSTKPPLPLLPRPSGAPSRQTLANEAHLQIKSKRTFSVKPTIRASSNLRCHNPLILYLHTALVFHVNVREYSVIYESRKSSLNNFYALIIITIIIIDEMWEY